MLHKQYYRQARFRNMKCTDASVSANKPVSGENHAARVFTQRLLRFSVIVSTNSRQFIAFLMESKLNIVLHDAPTLCIAVGELLVESVLAATSFFLSSTAFRISQAIQPLW
jgi:hypothetical protein